MRINFQEQVAGKTDTELIDIYVNANDYQKEFVNMVFDELNRRKVPIEKYQKEREQKSIFIKEQFEKGRQGNKVYIVLCFISALLGGLLGIIGGYVYSQSKHSDNSGERYYIYDKKTRDQGRIIMILGTFILLIILIWRFDK
jgi:hypothetical protein